MSLATLIGVADCMLVTSYRMICRVKNGGMWFSNKDPKYNSALVSHEGRNSYDHAMEIKNNPDLFAHLSKSEKKFLPEDQARKKTFFKKILVAK